MLKKGVSLIQLMVLIIILGILAVISIPNIKDIKKQSLVSSALENKTTVQKAVDRYFLEKQTLPSTLQPTLSNPQQIDLSKVASSYLVKSPQDTNRMYYWVDAFGTVWTSDIDSPNNVSVSGPVGATVVSFDEVVGAAMYQVGYIDQVSAFRVIGEINASSNYIWRIKGDKSVFSSVVINGRNVLQTVLTDDLTGKYVVVNAISKNGLETVPVSVGYMGSGLMAPDINPNAIKQIEANYHSSFLLKEDGTLWGFGLNDYGQLGMSTNAGTTNYNYIPTKIMTNVKTVSTGSKHTFAIKNDGTLWGFGLNNYGQLGTGINVGTTISNTTPLYIMDNVQSVSVGLYYTMILKNDDSLWMVGLNNYGQLGVDTNSGTTSANSSPVKIMTDVKSISAGWYHALVLKKDGTLCTFGRNTYGQLGTTANIGTSLPNPTPTQIMSNVSHISAGASHNMIIKNDKTLWSFGYNVYGQLGTITNSGTTNPNPTPIQIMTDIKFIEAGSYHNMAIKSDGTLWSFGYNGACQLGTTDNQSTSNPNPTPKQMETNVESATAGYKHTIILKKDGTLWSWGLTQYGQLGYSYRVGDNWGASSHRQITIP